MCGDRGDIRLDGIVREKERVIRRKEDDEKMKKRLWREER